MVTIIKNIFNSVYFSDFFVNIRNTNHLIVIIKKSLLRKTDFSPETYSYIYIGSFYYIMSDSLYLKAIKKVDHVYLDGFLLGWVLQFLQGKNFSVVDLNYLNIVVRFCEKENKRVFLLGSTKSTLQHALQNIKHKYPSIAIEGFYGYSGSNRKVIKRIRKFQPDLLLVSLGIQNQEKWVYKNLNALQSVKSIICCGIYADIWGGKSSFFPKILQKLCLRWLFRLLKEPKRLAKRYIIGFSFFLACISYFIFLRFIRILKRRGFRKI